MRILNSEATKQNIMLPGGPAGYLSKEYILLAEDDKDDVELLMNFIRELPESPEVVVLNKGDEVISFFENLSENRLFKPDYPRLQSSYSKRL